MGKKLRARTIYATGVFLTSRLIDGKYRWLAERFEDDSFEDGDVIDPDVVADTPDGLVHRFRDED
jgi:hypothetical protein